MRTTHLMVYTDDDNCGDDDEDMTVDRDNGANHYDSNKYCQKELRQLTNQIPSYQKTNCMCVS